MFLDVEGFFFEHVSRAKVLNSFEIMLLSQELVARIKVNLDMRDFRYGKPWVECTILFVYSKFSFASFIR